MSPPNKKTELRDLLNEARTYEVINRLRQLQNSQTPQVRKEITAVVAKFNRLENENARGILRRPEYEVETRRVVDSLTDLIDKIKEPVDKPREQVDGKAKPSSIPKPKIPPKVYVIGAIGILASSLLIVWLIPIVSKWISYKEGPDLPKMVHIQGRSFDMGRDELPHYQKPVHSVTVDHFYLAEAEVTNAQYCVFLNAKGNQVEGGSTWLAMSASSLIVQKGNKFIPKEGYADHPAIVVSWYGARAYCDWASEITGEVWRLPSEAEWEYAACGGAKARTNWAGTNLESELRKYSNFSGKHESDGFEKTAPVKSFLPNSLLLYDMSGNVREWCQDRWHRNYQGAPKNGIAWEKDGNLGRVLRGGSWDDPAIVLHVSNRTFNNPSARDIHIGFRPARTP